MSEFTFGLIVGIFISIISFGIYNIVVEANKAEAICTAKHGFIFKSKCYEMKEIK